ncbi:hypothetical protein BA059_02345 [Mycolicibacterium sp. (ex Dasyatis americana)]|nr:hypothetical protein BA059_02345 [Mycolicibacterium sp. (ex Dasyatis americana)]
MLSKLIESLKTSRTRLWLYTVAAAVLAVLVAYKIIEADKVPLWLALVGAILSISGNVTAGVNLAKQRRDGVL